MAHDCDFLIIGSGPAGVSAAFPLLQAGARVLMVDGGMPATATAPRGAFLEERKSEEQSSWMVGDRFYALGKMDTVSPKLRVPTHEHVFKNFLESNQIRTENFVAIGSLASGGLSNAWGCGVARLSTNDLKDFPFPESTIADSYAAVSRRMGISGGQNDDLSAYFGLDAWSQPAISMDAVHSKMFSRYSKAKSKLNASGFRIGRSRVAALSQPLAGRLACDLSDNCLWGCHRKSLYNSLDELSALAEFPNFTLRSGLIVDGLTSVDGGVKVTGAQQGVPSTVSAKKVLLAAGSLGSTRLAFQTTHFEKETHVDSCPTAAFLLWIPSMLGTERKDAFGLGQLSYSLDVAEGVSAFGSTFSTTGIPLSEFVRHLPLSRRYGVRMLRNLLSSCVVGNLFLPGHLSTSTAKLNAKGGLDIRGGFRNEVASLLELSAKKLRTNYFGLGAVMLPMSFTAGVPGGDIHYSGTMPMRSSPKPGETGVYGELFGGENIHVVDGACLPRLTEKSHTLTIMANADRIGRHLANTMNGAS